MLTYRLLRNHAGILLVGDYDSLSVLRDIVHDVNERAPIIEDKEGLFLALAYDARKASERQREILDPPKDFEEIGVRYGVEILWPVLLVQSRILRVSLGFIDHSKRHQAITYALEAVIEEALAEDFGAGAPAIKERWLRIDPTHSWPGEKLYSRGAQFCAWTKTQRQNHFAQLLDSLDPMYPTFYEMRARNGEKGLLSPVELDAWEGREWPDPKA